MKKMRLVLVMVLAMALAVPMAAFAAADLTVTGDTTIRLGYAENVDGKYELQGNWRTRANLDLRAGSGNVTGYARYRLSSKGFVPLAGTGNLYEVEDEDDLDKDRFQILEAYVDAKGSWLPGTPEATLRVGRFESRRMNDWVADFKRRDGARLSGIALGPATIDLYHAWNARDTEKVGDAGKGTDSVSAIIGSVNVDMVEVTGAFVTVTDRSGADYTSHSDYALGVNLTPASGISFGADFARDGDSEGTAWKVSGELDTIPNLTLRAATWNVDANFAPEYRHQTKQENLAMDRTWTEQPTAYANPWMEKGFSIGAETTQGGLPINVSFASGTIFELLGPNAGDNPNLGHNNSNRTKNMPFAGRDMSVFGVGTTIANIDLDLAYTKIEDVEPYTDVVAKHKLKGLPLGGDVDLTAVVRLQKDEDSKFGADAVWKAPNGLTLGLHYANYDRVQDWNHNYSNDNLAEGINIGKPGEADGFAVTAGYELKF